MAKDFCLFSLTRLSVYLRLLSARVTYTTAYNYKNMHETMPQDLLKRFKAKRLKEMMKKFDCLVYEILFIRALKLNIHVQSDSIRAKVLL